MRKVFYKIPILNKIVMQRDSLLKRVYGLVFEKKMLLEKIHKEKDTIKKEMECLSQEKDAIIKKKESFENIFLSPWTDGWKHFRDKNFGKIVELMNDLKSGMDSDSKKVIDTLWEKIIFLIPYNRYKKSFLYNLDDFFDKEELNGQKEKIDLSKYKLPKDVNIEEVVFKTKNGLSFLSEDITSQIKGKAVIDGGGYIGDSALVFCDYDPFKIYSFEPVDFLHDKLTETIKMNKVDEIIEPIKLGIGSTKKKKRIFGVDSGASLHALRENNYQNIEITTIDEFVKENKINVGLIKLDIEGFELEAVKGALNTIKKHRPILLIAIYHRPEDFFYIKPMLDRLNLGYSFIVRKTSPFRVTSETFLIGHVEQKFKK
jgi:FkbM family methyltransferase